MRSAYDGGVSDVATQLRKGVLELAILSLLEKEVRYGGQIVSILADYPGLAAGTGTVYPLLTRLGKEKLVTTTWRESASGPPRKYYRLTAAGRAALTGQLAAWRQLTDDVARIVEAS